VDDAGQLIDGRNRLRACEIAGIEPTFETFTGVDSVAYIVSTNKLEEFRGAALSRARTINNYAPELMDAVIGNVMSLKDAYEVALRRVGFGPASAANSAKTFGSLPFLTMQTLTECGPRP